MKLVELGLCTSPHYKISFVLDKTSMFKIKTVVKGKEKEAAVKPMEVRVKEAQGANSARCDGARTPPL